MGCHGVCRGDGLGQLMDPDEALDLAYVLRDHLYIVNILEDIESRLKSDKDSLSAIDTEIQNLNQKLDDLRQLANNLDREYQIYKFRHGLGELHSDFENTKLMRKETWAKMYQVEEDRQKLLSQLLMHAEVRDDLSNEINRLEKKFLSTHDFLKRKKNVVSLYSIVTLSLSGDHFSFVLVTEFQRSRISFGNLEVLSVDSPLGNACLGKRKGEAFSYVAPNGRTIGGDIMECEFPTAEQMDNLIAIVESRPVEQRPTQRNPFELVDRHGSNNSRYRKGG